MKKTLLVLLLAILISGYTNGQAFTKETWAANLGLGFGGYSYGYSASSLPSISFSIEKGMWDVEDVGIISLGGAAGWKYAKYDWPFSNQTYDFSWTDFIVVARGTLHPEFVDIEDVDLYGGLALGMRFQTYKHYTVLSNNELQERTHNNVKPLIAIYVGGRYYFSDQFGVFSELGFGLGYLTIGASYKF